MRFPARARVAALRARGAGRADDPGNEVHRTRRARRSGDRVHRRSNAPELIVVNGPLHYLDRIPLAGIPLKRAGRRPARDAAFRSLAQPNIDAGAQLMPELRGTLMPGRVARIVADYAADDDVRRVAAERLARALRRPRAVPRSGWRVAARGRESRVTISRRHRDPRPRRVPRPRARLAARAARRTRRSTSSWQTTVRRTRRPRSSPVTPPRRRLRCGAFTSPSRTAARRATAASPQSTGDVVAFVDDDVVLPAGFLAAHAREHAGSALGHGRRSDPQRAALLRRGRSRRPHNGSRRVLLHLQRVACRAPRSTRRAASTSSSDCTAGRTPNSAYGCGGAACAGASRGTPISTTSSRPRPRRSTPCSRKTTEKARMAARLVRKDPSTRTRLATGAYGANLLRAALMTPGWSLRHYAALARNEPSRRRCARSRVRAFSTAPTSGELRAALRDACRLNAS